MPHVIVKLWPGKSEDQKRRLADAISKDVMNILNYGQESVSVAIEEVSSKSWAEKVYKPDILDNSDKLYKKPGYTMQAASISPPQPGQRGTHIRTDRPSTSSKESGSSSGVVHQLRSSARATACSS